MYKRKKQNKEGLSMSNKFSLLCNPEDLQSGSFYHSLLNHLKVERMKALYIKNSTLSEKKKSVLRTSCYGKISSLKIFELIAFAFSIVREESAEELGAFIANKKCLDYDAAKAILKHTLK